MKPLDNRIRRMVHKSNFKKTAHEQALDDKLHERINEYANADELFAKLKIFGKTRR